MISFARYLLVLGLVKTSTPCSAPCEDLVDLKRVRARYRCSGGYVYAVLYRHLELKRRTRLYEWPERVGIDEHHFRRDRRLKLRGLVTMSSTTATGVCSRWRRADAAAMWNT